MAAALQSMQQQSARQQEVSADAGPSFGISSMQGAGPSGEQAQGSEGRLGAPVSSEALTKRSWPLGPRGMQEALAPRTTSLGALSSHPQRDWVSCPDCCCPDNDDRLTSGLLCW